VILTSELSVDAPLERTWAALLETQPAHGAWRGVLMHYGGTVSLDDVDEDERMAGFHVQGRELRGPGQVSARLTARLAEQGDATHLAVETDLRLSGHAEQLDREALQDGADALLNRLIEHLVQEVGKLPPVPPPEPSEAAPSGDHPEAGRGPERSVADLARELLEARAEEERHAGDPAVERVVGQIVAPASPRLDLGAAALGVAERALLLVAGTAIGLLAGRVVWRRR
jgi:hypothetical protein